MSAVKVNHKRSHIEPQEVLRAGSSIAAQGGALSRHATSLGRAGQRQRAAARSGLLPTFGPS